VLCLANLGSKRPESLLDVLITFCRCIACESNRHCGDSHAAQCIVEARCVELLLLQLRQESCTKRHQIDTHFTGDQLAADQVGRHSFTSGKFLTLRFLHIVTPKLILT
jgi:hypothetical protein